MAGIKIVTRKLVAFHGRDEEFSNVYYFGDGGAGLTPSEADTTALINGVINSEKTIFATAVRFLGGAGYKIGVADTPGDTDAVATVELSATGNNGAATLDASMYRECAIDLKFLLGGRRYLRTMLHTCAGHGTQADGFGATATSGLSAALKAYAEKQLNGPWVGSFQRIAPNGDRPTAIMYNPYMEHRQFHRYKKRRNAGVLG